MVQSVAGQLAGGQLSDRRPFRAPHHSAPWPRWWGVGLKVKPGEVSLAHNGVLFLDELPEFSPQVIDSLRQPLESGETIIARANNRVTYPSQFQLVAAMNPCKCGMAGTPGHTCRRGARCAADYQARLSGPFLDRIDIRIDVPAVSALDMIDRGKSEASEAIAQRVARARQMQHERFAQLGALTTHTNARASADSIEKVVELKDNSKKLLVDAAEKFNLSARGGLSPGAQGGADPGRFGQSAPCGASTCAEALGYRLNFNLG